MQVILIVICLTEKIVIAVGCKWYTFVSQVPLTNAALEALRMVRQSDGSDYLSANVVLAYIASKSAVAIAMTFLKYNTLLKLQTS